jgi:hypothetical protein
MMNNDERPGVDGRTDSPDPDTPGISMSGLDYLLAAQAGAIKEAYITLVQSELSRQERRSAVSPSFAMRFDKRRAHSEEAGHRCTTIEEA